MENSPEPTPIANDLIKDREAALKVFERISRRFAEGFDDSNSVSYGNLLKDLMDNSSLLVSGGLMSAKELLDKIEDLQEHIKQVGGGGKTVADQFYEWFNE